MANKYDWLDAEIAEMGLTEEQAKAIWGIGLKVVSCLKEITEIHRGQNDDEDCQKNLT